MTHNARPIAVDLYAGAGGMSLGFEQAGFDVAAAVEIDPVHALTHMVNFPQCAVLPRSTVGLSGGQIREAAMLEGEHVRVVCGGPPCQGFSTMGQRALDDPRNALVKEFVRIGAELETDYFVFENVRGITVGEHRRVLDELVEQFNKAGYEVQLPWRVLNASHYGVPQDRQRLFVLAARRGLALPDYPAETTSPALLTEPPQKLPHGPTCWQALGDIPNADDLEALLKSDVAHGVEHLDPSDYARSLRPTGPLGDPCWLYGHRRVWDPTVLTSSLRTVNSEISRARFAATAQGSVEPISRLYKLHPHRVANTLRAGTDAARGAFSSPRPIHYADPRCVTVREMARLHSFPDWFRFHSTKWHGARQVGNSVPPMLARAVATEVMRAAGDTPSASEWSMGLDNEEWLSASVGEAAKLLGVKAPGARRDRRSGQRKRSQAETEAERLSATK